MSMDSYAEKIRRLSHAVLDTPGALSPTVRHAVAARGAGRTDPPGNALPAALAAYVDTVTLHAYRVTPEDIAGLRAAGFSDDAIFEAILSAALGAGLTRLEQGLAALRKGR